MKRAIISIHPRHVSDIADGSKTAEIRSRRISLTKGSQLWIYATLPIGAIEVVAEIADVHLVSPTRAWTRFENSIGLSRAEFRSYVNGSGVVSVIRLTKVAVLVEPLSLKAIRRSHRGFQPPQFLKRLEEGSALDKLLAAARIRRIS